MENINWKIRFTNPVFWSHIAIAFIVPILTHFGYTWNDMESWDTLFNVVRNAFGSPVVVVAILVSVWNCILDPTTKGLSDSKEVLNMNNDSL